MPYAARRNDEKLNKAYAFVSRSCWTNSVGFLHDKLVSMGFEYWEAGSVLQPSLMHIQNRNEFSFTTNKLKVSGFTQEEAKILELREDKSGYLTMKLSKDTTRELIEKIRIKLPESARKDFKNTIDFIYKVSILSPAQRGEEISIPQLCINISGEWEVITDKEQYLPDGWNLLDCKAELSSSEFTIEHKGKTFEIDINGKKITNRYIQQTLTIDLDNLESNWTNSELSKWLDKNLRQPDIEQSVLLEFLRKMIEYLTLTRNILLTSLVRTKFILAKVINDKVSKYRTEAYAKACRELFVNLNQNIETKSESGFLFKFGQEYHPLSIYKGSKIFNKHFYEHIGDMNNEEENCAVVIDSLEEVQYWVRNIERSDYSFFLPTSTDKFYPDFIALLTDGRILAVEYKGEHLLSNDDTKEKRNIGKLWQEKSSGRCLFLLASKENLKQQIIGKIKEEQKCR
jgi:type III restriction enzyme